LLVNNAGFGTMGSFTKGSVEDQDLMIRVHITATMRLTRAALDVMLPKRSGAIINTSSVAAFQTNPGSVGYSASKTWINRFTEGLDLELQAAGSPVKLQALCPGFTYSEFHDVIKMDRERIPKAFWQSAEFVVETSLDGLDRGQLIVIPGWRYRLLNVLVGLIPKFVTRRAAISAGRRMGRV
jgi:short-subunit dehydrogenase